jgi:hypothetical protein
MPTKRKGATHKVETGGRAGIVRSGRVAGDQSYGQTEGEKVQLSEAVLRAVGLHGGTEADGETVLDKRETEGAVFAPAPGTPEECAELHQVQAYLAEQYGGYIERTKTKGKPQGKGKAKADRVTIKLTYGEDAEVVTGAGKNNREALRALCERLGETGFAAFQDDDSTEETDE